MRRFHPLAAAALTALVALGTTVGAGPSAADDRTREFVVVYRDGVPAAAARAAIRAAGGTIVAENAAVRIATVRASGTGFPAGAARQGALAGVARSRPIGSAPGRAHPPWMAVETERGPARGHTRVRRSQAKGEPLAGLQWDMAMIGATPAGSYRLQQGSGAVRVGIIDTGVDGSHPDIRPNFDRRLSRNFTIDVPSVDGPCAEEPDRSCSDPPDVDENGHGTHVAGTVGAPRNGLGMAGVAPRVTLVNLRAGNDSGFFFLQPAVDALTYAADHGIDVVNVSFFIDPWLYNCPSNAADSPAEQAEQRTIIEATTRALRYARDHGVTVVGSLGNEHTDKGHPTIDEISPDFPPGNEKRRAVDNTCLVLPAEGEGVIAVTALGPSGRKAYYSDYGLEEADVSAPGGDRRDHFGTPQYDAPENRILAPYPEALARANNELDATGAPTTPLVVRDCNEGHCAYYQWLQGTSMAAPHVAGVAALLVAGHGTRDRAGGGLTLSPPVVDRLLRAGATDTACPPGRLLDYPDLPEEFSAVCEGTPERNGFYGDGIVSAVAAARDDPE